MDYLNKRFNYQSTPIDALSYEECLHYLDQNINLGVAKKSNPKLNALQAEKDLQKIMEKSIIKKLDCHSQQQIELFKSLNRIKKD